MVVVVGEAVRDGLQDEEETVRVGGKCYAGRTAAVNRQPSAFFKIRTPQQAHKAQVRTTVEFVCNGKYFHL